MQIRPEQLRSALKAKLQSVYMVCGDEPLQHREALDMLRKAALYYGYEERESYRADAQFNWGLLHNAANELSLFAAKKVIEIQMPTGKPSDKGQALIEYCQHLPEDNLLLIIANKIEAATKKSKWYKAVDAVAGIITVWPIEGEQLNRWLQRRLQMKGLNLSPASLQLINERTEGNLLAADQEIEKLSLLYPLVAEQAPIQVNDEQVAEAVFDSARYNLFSLFDCALSGDLKRASRMLTGLQHEGQSIILILSLFAKEVRMLAKMSAILYTPGKQQTLDVAMQAVYIFPKRKPLIGKTLRRHGTEHWQLLLQQLLIVDKMSKGMQAGDPWQMMQLILSSVADKSYLSVPDSLIKT